MERLPGPYQDGEAAALRTLVRFTVASPGDTISLLARGLMADKGAEETAMAKTTGISRFLTVLALIVAPVGIVLTYNGADDLGVVFATVFSTTWLSLAMLIYYRKSTMERLRAHQESLAADPPE